MPFERPTLVALMRRARADLELALPGTDADLPYSRELILANMTAALADGCHGHIEWLARQVLPDRCDEEALATWARVFQVPRKQAAAARGSIMVSGEKGATCPLATVWQRRDGVRYTQLEPVVFSAAGTLAAPVAAEQAGNAGNLASGNTLNLVSPVAGIASQALVTGEIANGADQEKVESWRQRVLQRIRHPAKGGAPGDWAAWALEVPGVTRAWELPYWLGPGTIAVLFVCDEQPGSPIPNEPMVAQVQAHLAAKAPILSTIYALAPAPLVVDYKIEVEPNTPEVRAAIVAELEDWYGQHAEPGKALYLSQIQQPISGAEGESHHVLIQPAADILPQRHELPVLGEVNFG